MFLVLLPTSTIWQVMFSIEYGVSSSKSDLIWVTAVLVVLALSVLYLLFSADSCCLPNIWGWTILYFSSCWCECLVEIWISVSSFSLESESSDSWWFLLYLLLLYLSLSKMSFRASTCLLWQSSVSYVAVESNNGPLTECSSPE